MHGRTVRHCRCDTINGPGRAFVIFFAIQSRALHSMNPKVFLNYRRDDSAAYAGRIEDRLRQAFGPNLLFMDVDNIPLGMNFAKVLDDEIAKCDILLALIGHKWLSSQDDEGKRRLDKPDDFVRIEIATALRRNIRVIPILLDGSTVPKADELPEELKELALRAGLEIRHVSFHSDMNRLIRRLKAPYRPENVRLVAVGGLAGLLVGVLPTMLLTYFWWWASFWWWAERSERVPFLDAIRPLDQRVFECATLFSCGVVAAWLRQRYKIPTAVWVSGALALCVFAVGTDVLGPITVDAPALAGPRAFLFYFFIVLMYCLVSYGVFRLYEHTPSILKSLLAVGVAFHSVIALFFSLLIFILFRFVV